MILVVQIQLLPDPDQARRLRETVEQFNAAADWAAARCFERRSANFFEMKKSIYRESRDIFGLSGQITAYSIKVACDTYRRDLDVQPHFHPLASMPFDRQMMRFVGQDQVSLTTGRGRLSIPFLVGEHAKDRMLLRKGQCDLLLRPDGKWFLLVTVTVPEPAVSSVSDVLGVDLGIVNIAVDSDGTQYTGSTVEWIRSKHNKQRRDLQQRCTKGAKKKLRRLAGKEARYRRHVNHVISKHLVQLARGTGRAIALEDLQGIRNRITARSGDQRQRLNSWAFRQLRIFITYKAKLHGIPVVLVQPHNTSRTCSRCGHCARNNRKTQSAFLCSSCGYMANADHNAARNIRALGIVNYPELEGVTT